MTEFNTDHLNDEEFEITQNCGTELPFTGEYLKLESKGVYHCKVCDNILFSSATKYDSGTGWPSFYDKIKDNIKTKKDTSNNLIRTEIICSKCNSHLGHLFDDGPEPTGSRYCVNSLSLKFKDE